MKKKRPKISGCFLRGFPVSVLVMLQGPSIWVVQSTLFVGRAQGSALTGTQISLKS